MYPYYFNNDDIRVHHSRDVSPVPQEMHAHWMHELFYFISGKGSYYIEGTNYPLKPGCLLLMRVGETHRIITLPEYPYERISIHFSPSVLNIADPHGTLDECVSKRPLGQKNQYLNDILDENLIQSCLYSITNPGSYTANPQYRRVHTISGIYMVLCELQRCYNLPKPTPPQSSDDIISQTITYINENLTRQFNLDYLGKMFFVDKSYLNSKFKQVTGSTIWEYTIVKRLLLAREHIRNGISAMEAAEKCGWNDYSSFFRRYKTRFGISPSDDRKRFTSKHSDNDVRRG